LEKFIIKGGTRLSGEVVISGAKNAAVAILPASLLANTPCLIDNVPAISDVMVDLRILSDMGAQVQLVGKNKILIDPRGIRDEVVPYELARSMRASYYFLGVLLARFNHAKVSMPGGCDLGDRPIDQHLKVFRALGATCTIEHGIVEVDVRKLIGTQIYFDKYTVGATINAILASVYAEGLTILENAAKEPHIVDLANFLNSMGANITGAGTDVIKIRGVARGSLHGTEYTIIPDLLEAGTIMVAAAATQGSVVVRNVIPKHLDSVISKLRQVGALVTDADDYVTVTGTGERYKSLSFSTLPHPGFPTDMQPQFTALLSVAQGVSVITDAIFDNRFRFVDELRRMGADVDINDHSAVIRGVDKYTGAPVKAADLRAGAALIIAGLCAEGVTEIEDIYHIERGYEDIDMKLRALGADIVKRKFPDSDDVLKAV
jgi:UDP-N-acetylglucosamine 1-carboxyvinyltransferase